MTAVAEKVMESAMSLSPIDRAELIERLFFSFDPSPDRGVDKSWEEEIESRIDAYDAGKIKASPASEVFNRISAR
jgi:putative addiction module component (TIGR02574 family)